MFPLDLPDDQMRYANPAGRPTPYWRAARLVDRRRYAPVRKLHCVAVNGLPAISVMPLVSRTVN